MKYQSLRLAKCLFAGFLFLHIGSAIAVGQNAEETIANLKNHYSPYYKIPTYRLHFSRISSNPFQSYDYTRPDRVLSYVTIGLDFQKHQFYAERKNFYPGGYLFEFNEFQTGNTSIGYDPNGILFGKRLFTQNTNRINEVEAETATVVDFLAVKEMLEEKDTKRISIADKTDLQKIVVNYSRNSETSIEFTFNRSPIYLISTLTKPDNVLRHYSNYSKRGGLMYANLITQYRGGNYLASYVIESVVGGEELPENSLIIPKGYASVPDEADVPLIAVEIYKGLFLVERVAGDRNVLFTMRNDGIVVFGAPISDSWSKRVIEVIRSKFPDKRISYVYVTHFHSDHIGGLGAYLDKGATVLVNEFSVEAIKERTQFKDLPPGKLKFETIEDGVNFDGIEFHIVANSHAKDQSFVYFRKAKMIYEGDFLEVPFDNTIPNYMPQATRQFLDYMSEKQLKFERIIGHHRNSNIRPSVVEEYVRRFEGADVVY